MQNITLELKFKPRAWQKTCIEHQSRFTVLALHRRAGKTTLSVFQLLARAMSVQGLYAYVAPQLKQARLIAWDMMKAMCEDFISVKGSNGKPLVEVHETEPYLQLFNGSKIMLLGADDPDKLRGSKLAGVIVDEVAQMPKEIWGEILYPALMDSKGWALFIGTPKGVNLFSDLFYRGQDPTFLPLWSSKRFTCYETDVFTPKEIEDYKKGVDENTFRQEMLCDFTVSASNQLLSLEQVNTSMHLIPDQRQLSVDIPLVLGVDVARYGDDRSILFFRRGQVAEEPIVLRDLNVPELASVIKKHCFERKPKAIFVDGTGVGGGVVDMLQLYGINVFEINFNMKPADRRYSNKRAEMWSRMANWVKSGGILPQNLDLAKELCAPLYESDESGRISIERKADIKKRLGYSPDLADGLALTFAEELYDQQPSEYEAIMLWKSELPKGTPFSRFENRIKKKARSCYGCR